MWLEVREHPWEEAPHQLPKANVYTHPCPGQTEAACLIPRLDGTPASGELVLFLAGAQPLSSLSAA